jgi:hypothetical protein
MGLVAAVAAGAAVALLLRRAAGKGDEAHRWLAVTIDAPPEAVRDDARVRERLDAVDEAILIRVETAPGDRGTELAVRLRDERRGDTGLAARIAGRDPRQALRRALRDAKALVETGEVLELEPADPHMRGPGGALIEAAGRRAQGEGRL